MYNVSHFGRKCCVSHLYLSVNHLIQTHPLTFVVNNPINNALSMLQSIIHKMDKRKSFVISRQYENCFSQRINSINALVLGNLPIKTATGMVIHNFHGLKTMTFYRVADISHFCLAVTEIIQFCTQCVTSEICSKT